ncbi:extracellular proline-serine rich protein [Phlyctema vagabunda]|uniref:Extracellular proline-serine rich protein n=1 Tax=Phlyctema vagabunda TaxID=108571 RepID=A0ABR4P9M3_9HELO
MQFSNLFTLSSLLAAVSAYTVLTPTANSTVAKGNTVNVQWTSVDTDATTFSIYLVNFQAAHFPPTVLSLAQNVPQEAGSLDVRIPCDVSSDYGWQLNFINGTNTYVIYAQSPAFTLTGDCVDPVSTSSSAVATTTLFNNSTVTATATATLIQTVETVVYETPVVWFVQPGAVVEAGAMCPPAAQQTVTVQVPVTYAAVCPGSASPTGLPGAPGVAGNYSLTSVTPKSTTAGVISSTGAVLTPTSATSATPSVFTGAASNVKVGGSVLALAGAVALFL